VTRVPEFVCSRDFSFIGRNPDTNLTDAREMARKIEALWRARGYRVACRIDPVKDHLGRVLVYNIRSDLRNGLPRTALSR
jgi:hypothetical protein